MRASDNKLCHVSATNRALHEIASISIKVLHTLKWFTIVDEYTRRCITLDVARKFKSKDIIDCMAEFFLMYGVPRCIRSDNGPEFIAKAIQGCLKQLEVGTLYIEPGKLWENGYAESFHSRLRYELLHCQQFASVLHARRCAIAWQNDNNYRPHSSLGGTSPAEFAVRGAASVPAAPSLRKQYDPLSITQT